MQDQATTEVFSTSLQTEIDTQYGYLMLIVVVVSVVLFGVIGIVILCFTRSITGPIKKLTDLTNYIKREPRRDKVRAKIDNASMFNNTRKLL